jgi:hypothetical protein
LHTTVASWCQKIRRLKTVHISIARYVEGRSTLKFLNTLLFYCKFWTTHFKFVRRFTLLRDKIKIISPLFLYPCSLQINLQNILVLVPSSNISYLHTTREGITTDDITMFPEVGQRTEVRGYYKLSCNKEATDRTYRNGLIVIQRFT